MEVVFGFHEKPVAPVSSWYPRKPDSNEPRGSNNGVSDVFSHSEFFSRNISKIYSTCMHTYASLPRAVGSGLIVRHVLLRVRW